jgi:ribosomal protein S12 methylthiotransferase
MRISIQSLGCPKNFVDSEVICGYLLQGKHTLTNELENSDVAIINTCSFIQPAVEESIDTILQAVRLKSEGRLKYIIVAGCLPQRYQKHELRQSLPEVDVFMGVDEISQINNIIEKLHYERFLFQVNPKPCYIYDENSPRFLLTPKHYAYLKIAEGCNNACSYCLIPKIKGRYRSRSIESIISEAKNLIKSYPLKEIILIAEDTTFYGMDNYNKFMLSDLLQKMVKITHEKEIKIRILYTHPAHYDDRLIETISQNPMICSYIDIPLQHISDKILQKMNRKICQEDIIKLIEKLRMNIPNLTIRTTFIVGFPGETEKDFQQLYEFLKKYRFEKVGVFPFYNEEGCSANKFPEQIPAKTKKERLDALMTLQQQISLELQTAQIGKVQHVLIDEISQKNEKILIGRSCREAPEIDGNISIINGDYQDIGKWIDVKISRAYPYNLVGEKICK